LLYPYGSQKTLDAMVSLLKDDDPLVRVTSMGGTFRVASWDERPPVAA